MWCSHCAWLQIDYSRTSLKQNVLAPGLCIVPRKKEPDQVSPLVLVLCKLLVSPTPPTAAYLVSSAAKKHLGVHELLEVASLSVMAVVSCAVEHIEFLPPTCYCLQANLLLVWPNSFAGMCQYVKLYCCIQVALFHWWFL